MDNNEPKPNPFEVTAVTRPQLVSELGAHASAGGAQLEILVTNPLPVSFGPQGRRTEDGSANLAVILWGSGS